MNTKIYSPIQYTKKVEQLEKELFKLKKKSFVSVSLSLKGTLKGVKITHQDLESAKKSLFKKVKT